MSGWNGTGGFSFTSTFVPATTISSSAMNGNFTDAVTGFTNCVTRDGQGYMSAQFKIIAGSAAAPGIAFSSDLDTGIWRVSANTVGFAANGANVMTMDSTGLVVVGNVTATSFIGAVTPTGQIGGADGTAAAPTYTFASDLDNGFYRIGANNVGLSIGGTKRWDYSTTTSALTGNLTVSGTVTIGGNAVATAAYVATGTSGATIPLLNGANTFSGVQTFSAAPVVTAAGGITANNSAKAFAAFTQSGTTVTYDSTKYFNVASIVRTNVGIYTVTFTNALPTANYTVVSTGSGTASGSRPAIGLATSLGTGSFTFTVYRASTEAVVEAEAFSLQVFGF